jgi:hypothetical protein
MPDLTPVHGSSSIAAAGWNADTGALTVQFVNGRSYTHENVPAGVLEELLSAPSAGRYYNDSIKGVY